MVWLFNKKNESHLATNKQCQQTRISYECATIVFTYLLCSVWDTHTTIALDVVHQSINSFSASLLVDVKNGRILISCVFHGAQIEHSIKQREESFDIIP